MMIEKELKQEAEEKAKKRTKGFKCQDNCEKSYVMGALDFAEPREKRIAELEAQIEGMKRYLDCEYCEHYTQRSGCKNCNEEIRSDWKLKEE